MRQTAAAAGLLEIIYLAMHLGKRESMFRITKNIIHSRGPFRGLKGNLKILGMFWAIFVRLKTQAGASGLTDVYLCSGSKTTLCVDQRAPALRTHGKLYNSDSAAVGSIDLQTHDGDLQWRKGHVNMAVGANYVSIWSGSTFIQRVVNRDVCSREYIRPSLVSRQCRCGWQNNYCETQLTEYFKRDGNYASLKAHMRTLIPPLFLPVYVFICATSRQP